MSKRKEIAEVKRRRKVLKSGLELSRYFESLAKQYKLTHWQAVEVLQNEAQVYLNIAISKERRG